ncbi:cysteinyl leukotriene receptor 1-like isoform X1 [Protopterus annectens]|uniref:cysteinyl leukotriene receptor 1-like isoform X1 n=1 Tax=Protopterus annectens TaxID=7888 RepID=UPI001CFB37D9|nr:cysteinyl leukotriene receptor 1-like isoform X1 [Protopterus annectens]XP_043926466.1 cysteinyl leukotriene receptor 1-like isoform X1 [Protopterus annectens]XP_043926467.1 cysteinyl leukotriene receptor 1-like isoform X1 [Protopterus annectens]XP_043926468.1 cysteinyl leukotriene receptor 1-like isoform X1 [Protopterus annectens]XP_043926470.1 cysteinyl leukotriene receptor 1-like isoform X1 [Protopterus annectens]
MSETGDTNTSFCQVNDNYKHKVYAAVYSIVFTVGFCCNILALYVFYKFAKRKSATTVYLISLAMADLLLIISLPFRIAYFHSGGVWIFGDVICRVCTFLLYFSMYTSIYLLTCISVSRCLIVIRLNILRPRKILIICAAVWLFVGASTIPFTFLGTQVRDNITRCFEPSGEKLWTSVFYMNYYAFIIGFIIPFIMIITSYGIIIKQMMKTDRSKRKNRKDKAMIILIPATFCLCFLPYHIQRTVHLHYFFYHRKTCEIHEALEKSVVATLCLAVANCCFDPLLYVFLGQGFRRLWKPLLCRTAEISQASSSSGNNNQTVVNTTVAADTEMTPL